MKAKKQKEAPANKPPKKIGAPYGNQNAIGNEGGRPLFYKTPELFQLKVDEYFETGRNEREIVTKEGVVKIPVFTVTGLALFLGFSSRQSFLDYNEKVEFIDVIKKAKSRVEMYYEEGLSFGQCTGQIFALKNMGWRDQQELDHKNNGGAFDPSNATIIFK